GAITHTARTRLQPDGHGLKNVGIPQDQGRDARSLVISGGGPANNLVKSQEACFWKLLHHVVRYRTGWAAWG
ncbi:hypothetical protein, partial [Xanthomonas populi]|uniref:hypothetical protein n=1 Tax=Xanthomonas populi TaxID=53414 RepID=UPI001ABF55A6